MRQWQLREAKARLSGLVKAAVEDGPQEITVHGRPAAVVLSTADFDRLKRRKPTMREFLRRSALVGVDLDLERDSSPLRDVDQGAICDAWNRGVP